MDLHDYISLKTRGLVSLKKIGITILAEKKKFCAESGMELKPELEMVDIDQLVNEQDKINGLLDNLKELMKDAKKLL